MAGRYRVETAHYLPGDLLVEAGEEVGEGTRYPLPKDFVPSRSMVPLDAAAESALKKRGIKNEPLAELTLGDKGKRGKSDVPAESAPGVPYHPWEAGAVGPEGGPNDYTEPGRPMGYDEVDPSKLRATGGSQASDIEEAPARAPRRAAPVEDPNRQLEPKDVDADASFSTAKTGTQASGKAGSGSGAKKTL